MSYFYRRKKNVSKATTSIAKVPVSWNKRDEAADCFYAYILKLSDNTYYVGHTRELRERLIEHKDSTTLSTANKNPKLQYFECLATRELAQKRESELKQIDKNNHREILRLINGFHDLVRELNFD